MTTKISPFWKGVYNNFVSVIIIFKLPECAVQGKIIPCLLDHRRNLTVPSCKHMMTRMQAIFFSDYRLIENFLDDCSKDVHKFSCGRLQTEEEDEEVCFYYCLACVMDRK